MNTNPSAITAVTFDVWETLIKDYAAPSGRRAQLRAERMSDVLRRYGYSTDPLQVRETYNEAVRELDNEVWSKYHDVGTREQLNVIMSLFDPSLSSPPEESLMRDLSEAYTTPIFDFPPVLAPGAHEALKAVQTKGLRIGLVCNTGVTPGVDMRKLLDRYGVLSYFESLAFSDEVGFRKPRPEIFRQVLDALRVAPAQAVHIGDDPIADIGGAKGIGMKAIMVRTAVPPQLPVSPDLRIKDLFSLPQALEELY